MSIQTRPFALSIPECSLRRLRSAARSPPRRNTCYSMRDRSSLRWDFIARGGRARFGRNNRYMKGVFTQNTRLLKSLLLRIWIVYLPISLSQVWSNSSKLEMIQIWTMMIRLKLIKSECKLFLVLNWDYLANLYFEQIGPSSGFILCVHADYVSGCATLQQLLIFSREKELTCYDTESKPQQKQHIW